MLTHLLEQKYSESILQEKRTKLVEEHVDPLVVNINLMQQGAYFKELRDKYPNLIPHLHRFLVYGDIQEDGTTLVTHQNLRWEWLKNTYQDIFLANAMIVADKDSWKKWDTPIDRSSWWGIERVRVCTDISMALYYIYLREQWIQAVNASWIINRIAKVTTVKYSSLSLTEEQSLNDQIKSNPGMMLWKLWDVLDNMRSLWSDPDMVESGYLAYKKDVRTALEQGRWYPSLGELRHDEISASQKKYWQQEKYKFSTCSRNHKYLTKIKKYEWYLASINVQWYGWLEKFIPRLYQLMGMSTFYETDDNLVKINIDILGLQEKKNSANSIKKSWKQAIWALIPWFTEKQYDAEADVWLDDELFRYIRNKWRKELQRPLNTANHDEKSSSWWIDLLPSVTLLDLYTSSWWTKQMVFEFLVQLQWVTWEVSQKNIYSLDENSLSTINALFERAFSTYLYDLGAYKRLPKQFQQKWLKWSFKHGARPAFRWFTSFEDIYAFVSGSEDVGTMKPLMQRIRCSVLKLAYVEWVVAQSNPSLEQNEEFFGFITRDFVSLLRVVPADKKQEFEEFIEQFNQKIDKSAEDYQQFCEQFSSYMFTVSLPKGTEDTTFLSSETIARIEIRRKLDRNQVQKLIADPKYNMLSALQDTFGIRIHVYGQDQWLKTANFLRKHLYKKQASFGNKNFFKDKEKFEMVYWTHNGIDEQFLDLVKNTITDWEKSDKSSTAFQGTDLTWSVWLSQNLETQIVYYGNVNETKWTSHRGIYEAKKNIREMIRLEWYVSRMYMRDMLREKIREYKHDLYPYGGWDEQKAVNHFFDAITTESDLFSKLSIDVNGVRRSYYVLTERRQELDFWYLLPTWARWTIDVWGEGKRINGNRYLALRKKHKKLDEYISSQVDAITRVIDRKDRQKKEAFTKLMSVRNDFQQLLRENFAMTDESTFEEKHREMVAHITGFQKTLAIAA